MLVIVSSILIGLMVLFVAARLYTKLRINRKLKWDDCKSHLALYEAFMDWFAETLVVTCVLAMVMLLAQC